MPEHEAREVRSVAGEGVIPQNKQYGSTLARSLKNKNTFCSGSQSLFFLDLTFPIASLPKKLYLSQNFFDFLYMQVRSVNIYVNNGVL